MACVIRLTRQASLTRMTRPPRQTILTRLPRMDWLDRMALAGRSPRLTRWISTERLMGRMPNSRGADRPRYPAEPNEGFGAVNWQGGD